MDDMATMNDLEKAKADVLSQLEAGHLQLKHFEGDLEQSFWQFMFNNQINLIREGRLLVTFTFVLAAFPTLLAVFNFTESTRLPFEGTLWFIAVLIAAMTLYSISYSALHHRSAQQAKRVAAVALFILHTSLASITYMYTSPQCVTIVTIVLVTAQFFSYFLITLRPIQLSLLLCASSVTAFLGALVGDQVQNAPFLIYILLYSCAMSFLIGFILNSKSRFEFLQLKLLTIEHDMLLLNNKTEGPLPSAQ